ncbi:hypothetical protein ABPG72_003411 [Tetrahymena utriculariae]
MKQFQNKIKDFINKTQIFNQSNQDEELIVEKGSENYKILHSLTNRLFQNSVLTIKIYDLNQQQVECNFSWNCNNYNPNGFNSTSRNSHVQEQDDFKNYTNMYEFSAEDINQYVRVFIHPKKDPSTEIILKIGPIQMDPDTKYTVQSVLYSGIVNIPVKIGKDLECANMIISPQNIIIRLSSQHQNDYLKILNHLTDIRITYSEKKGPISEKNFKLIFPKRSVIQNNSLLPCIQLENVLEIQSESRYFRDYIYIVLRSLAAKQTFIDEKIISNLNIDPKSYIKDFSQFTEAILKYIHHSKIQNHYQYLISKLKDENKCLLNEVDSMEEECHLVIQTFKQILQQQGISCSEEIEYQTRKDYRMSRRDIQEENSTLKEKIQQLEEELQFLQNFNSSSNNNNNGNSYNSRLRGTNSRLSNSGKDELISQKESESIIKQVEKKYQIKLQKSYMELEEIKDQLNSKIQEQILIINNLENKNHDLRSQIQILEKSQNYFSVERRSITQNYNQGNNNINRELEGLKRQLQQFQIEMNQKQMQNEEILKLQLQNQQLKHEVDKLKQNFTLNFNDNNNFNNSTLTTARAKIFDNTPVRSRNNTIHNEEGNQNQTRTFRSSSYNNIPSQRNATSTSLTRPYMPAQETSSQTNRQQVNSSRQRIPSVNNSYNFVTEPNESITHGQQLIVNNFNQNSCKTLQYINANNKENLNYGNNLNNFQTNLNSNINYGYQNGKVNKQQNSYYQNNYHIEAQQYNPNNPLQHDKTMNLNNQFCVYAFFSQNMCKNYKIFNDIINISSQHCFYASTKQQQENKGQINRATVIMKDEKQAQSQFNHLNSNEKVNEYSKLKLIEKNQKEKLLLYNKTTHNDLVRLIKLKQNKQTQSFHENGTQTERLNTIFLNEQFEKKQLTLEQVDTGKTCCSKKRHKSLNRYKKSLSIFQNNIIYGALVAPRCNINIVEFKLPKLNAINNCMKPQKGSTLGQQAQFSQLILPPILSPEQTTNFKSKLFSDIKKERFQKFNCDLKERIFKIQDNYINKIQFNQFLEELF